MLNLHLESNDTFSVNILQIAKKLEFLNWRKCLASNNDIEICGEYTTENLSEIVPLFLKEI
jgi:hypothetical protein